MLGTVDEQNWPGKNFYGVVLKGYYLHAPNCFHFADYQGIFFGVGGCKSGLKTCVPQVKTTGKCNDCFLSKTSFQNGFQGWGVGGWCVCVCNQPCFKTRVPQVKRYIFVRFLSTFEGQTCFSLCYFYCPNLKGISLLLPHCKTSREIKAKFCCRIFLSSKSCHFRTRQL